MNDAMLKKTFTRRVALQLLGSSALAASGLVGCHSATKKQNQILSQHSIPHPSGNDVSPIDRTISDQKIGGIYSGDQPHKSHQALKNLEPHGSRSIAQVKKTKSQYDVIIVGGGISGLTSAWLLKKHKVLLIEKEDRMGGNAKAESWRGIDYPLGSAYFSKPEPGSPLSTLIKELSLQNEVTTKTKEDPFIMDQKWQDHFWETSAEPEAKRQFALIKKHIEQIIKEQNIVLDLPNHTVKDRRKIAKLDQQNFYDYLKKSIRLKTHLKENFHLQVSEYLETFCQAAFGASAKEISAASGMYFFAAEFLPIQVLPGGNARIAEKLTLHLSKLKNVTIQSKSTVVHVTSNTPTTTVTYLDGNLQEQNETAKYVVMACPKFICTHIVEGISPKQRQAFQKIEYRSYLVANALLESPHVQDFYDLFFYQSTHLQKNDIQKIRITDVITSQFTQKDSKRVVLTLEVPLTYTGARQDLLNEENYSFYHTWLKEELQKNILPQLNLSMDHLIDLRLTRWGHPLPVAKTGLLADGHIDQIRRPHQNIYFVNQDNWALPAFETATSEAYYFSNIINKKLNHHRSTT